MGGAYDSSRTRVTPVFSAVQSLGSDWLPRLLYSPQFGPPDADRVRSIGSPVAGGVHFGGPTRKEKRLAAPPSLLKWLVRNVEQPIVLPKMSADVRPRRHALFDRDTKVIDEAIARIDAGHLTRGWHILEGPTAPDVFIETDDALIVIEGKRTEVGPTTNTTWLPGRHQMWRHIDAAWDVRGVRRVLGFFIVEGDADGAVPVHWQKAAEDTWSDAALKSSLPHRSPDERAALRRCFLGVTTWQRVVRALGLPSSVLPANRAAAEAL